MEEGISLFSSLLNNKHFLIVFVHALEQQKDFAVRDRCGPWSLQLPLALYTSYDMIQAPPRGHYFRCPGAEDTAHAGAVWPRCSPLLCMASWNIIQS